MANGNGRNPWQVMKDIIQVLILPLLVLVWNQVSSSIKDNADLLRKIEGNQIRVIQTIGMLESEMNKLESDHAKASAERARVHHTSNRSCLECKMGGFEHRLDFLRPNPPAKVK